MAKLRGDYFRRRTLSRIRHSDDVRNFLVTQAARLGLTQAQVLSALAGSSSMTTLRTRRGWTPCTNKVHMCNNGQSSGANQAATYRTRYNAVRAVTSIKLLFQNSRLASGVETDDADTVTYRATVETGVGTNTVAVTFNGGQTSVDIAPGGYALSDEVVVSFSAGTNFFVRTRVSVDGAGKKWPVGQAMVVSGSTLEGFVSTDFLTGAVPSLSSAGAVGPVAILSRANAVGPAVAILGSSSSIGQGDTRANDSKYDAGYLAKALSASNIPHVNLSVGGDTLLNFITTSTRRRQILSLAEVNTVIFQLGGNDITNAVVTLADMQTRYLEAIRILKGVKRDLNIIGCTITPTVTTSDAYATLANQTVHARNAVRIAFNDWLKSGAVKELTRVLDPCATVEDATAPGKFKVDGTSNKYTADGTHLTEFAHNAVRDALGTITL